MLIGPLFSESRSFCVPCGAALAKPSFTCCPPNSPEIKQEDIDELALRRWDELWREGGARRVLGEMRICLKDC